MKKFLISILILVMFFSFPGCSRRPVKGMPELQASDLTASVDQALSADISSEEFVRRAWEASAQNDIPRVEEIVTAAAKYFGGQALLEQSAIKGFPERGRERDYQTLNDVAVLNFILAEAYMIAGRKDEAIALFSETIETYPSALAWDPSRGAFWSVAEKSQASIDVLTGKAQAELDRQMPEDVFKSKPVLHIPGKERVVDYAKYGEFKNIGTADYEYVIKDMQGLREAVGEGIYPNDRDVYQNPRLEEVRAQGRLKNKHWDYNLSQDLEAAYFKWVSAPESPGVKLFYIANTFERAEMWDEAVKAYYALLVHFPKTVAWTYWNTPWYPSQAAAAKLRFIINTHPELGLAVLPGLIKIEHSYNNSADDDVFITDPGRIIDLSRAAGEDLGHLEALKKSLPLDEIKRKVGKGKVRLVQYINGHWQLLVDDQPFVIKAVTYTATKVGQTPDKGTLTNWQFDDFNKNGLIDGPYESWVDTNRNNVQDGDEPTVGDFQLMKEMGVNVIRLYHVPSTPNKELLRDLYKTYGIRVIMGDFLGKYAIGSGATWAEGTDYANPEHQKKMMEAVKKMVKEHKDEPYLLMWLLGNENNYGVGSNADKNPEAFFKFANQAAEWIKSVDEDHPVAVSNGDTLYLDVFAEHAPAIDIFAANIYRGDYGFGSFWQQVADVADKPAFIAEYGAPAFAPHLTLEEGEQMQAHYHRGNWMDIVDNMAGSPRGRGNALGGVVFEWMDEWWKNYEPYLHDRKSDAIGPFAGGYYFEEWFGIIGQGNGTHSPYLRHLRKAYDAYRQMWNP